MGELLDALERDCAAEFRCGFIAESPQKLRRIAQYFAAVRGRAAFPPVRCNAPEFSAVIGAHGEVHPCFFISGPPLAAAWAGDLDERLNDPQLRSLRRRHPRRRPPGVRALRVLDVARARGPFTGAAAVARG